MLSGKRVYDQELFSTVHYAVTSFTSLLSVQFLLRLKRREYIARLYLIFFLSEFLLQVCLHILLIQIEIFNDAMNRKILAF